MPVKPTDSTNIFQWNARSITTNAAYLIEHLANNNYQILLLQSLNVCKNKLPRIPGFYYPPVHQSADEKEIIKTAIYIKEDTEYCIRPSPAPNDLKNLHSCAATIKISNGVILNVASVYLPKGPDDQNTEWLKAFQNTSDKWLVAGDFNAHSSFWEKDCPQTTSNRLVENIMDSSLYLLNDGRVTRIPDISTHRATSIDLSLISPELACNSTWQTFDDTLGSDHVPIIIKLNEKHDTIVSTKDKIPKYNYKYADWTKFENILNSCDINNVNDEDINLMYSNIRKLILSAADESIPKVHSVQKNKHTGNVWWTKACEIAVENKKVCYKEYIRNRTAENHVQMKKAKIDCNRIIAQAKRQYWSSFCVTEISSHKDIQKVWKKFHEMKQGPTLPQCPIKVENNKFPTLFEKAEAFVDMYANTMRLDGLSSECRCFRNEEEKKDLYKEPAANNTHYTNAPITIQEVKEAILSLTTKKSSVGLDAISNEMLKHLPEKFIALLHCVFQKVWLVGSMPDVWKQSIIVPILKQGKPRTDKNSYRPIALTSHVAKLMEKIVLQRMVYYCEKNSVIPHNQAGFRKGRSTIDHIVKLTTQIKQQFARRKSVLATFFDVKKAYDTVWHARLLYKLKSAGFSGNFYNYIKTFLQGRSIQARVGYTYSSSRYLQMGIPQGSVIAPFLFNVFIHDLPKCLTKNVTLVQFADDICMWMNVSMKKNTQKRSLNYIRKLYQADLDNLSKYMSMNGLSLAKEKTNMLLFNNGDDPINLPVFHLEGECIKYQRLVKFLGVFLTSKLSWNYHVEHILNKARKSLNLIKMISGQHFGQDVLALKHLSTALVRSKLCYAQEAFFSAPKYLLNKIQSVDCKAYKVALGVPCHASTLGTYKEINVLPLEEQRKLAVTKYFLKCSAIDKVNECELAVKSESDYPKRAQQISSLTSIGSYTADLLQDSNIDPKSLSKTSILNPVPPWERKNATFDINHTELKKEDQPHVLSYSVKLHVQNNYPNHLKVYTDGSLLSNKQSGSAFVIPSLKVNKSYSIGENRSIFSAELVAIVMALNYLIDLPFTVFRVLICVDSKSVLQSLQSSDSNVPHFIVNEAKHLLHLLICKGTEVTFCWVPSHCGILGNELADKSARKGARNDSFSKKLNIPLGLHEAFCTIKRVVWHRFVTKQTNSSNLLTCKSQLFTFEQIHNIQSLNIHNVHTFKYFMSIFYRLKLNAFKTKYSKMVKCLCGQKITASHILFDCLFLKRFLPVLSGHCMNTVFFGY